jgi:hypothetical protein
MARVACEAYPIDAYAALEGDQHRKDNGSQANIKLTPWKTRLFVLNHVAASVCIDWEGSAT